MNPTAVLSAVYRYTLVQLRNHSFFFAAEVVVQDIDMLGFTVGGGVIYDEWTFFDENCGTAGLSFLSWRKTDWLSAHWYG